MIEGRWTIHVIHKDGSKELLAEGTNRIVKDGKSFIINDIKVSGNLEFTEYWTWPARGELCLATRRLLESQRDTD